MILRDSFQREINYLRISITDRCNFRCKYCKPFDQFEHFAREEMLSLEEITEITRVFVSLGIRKVRITGGEPLIRKGVEGLIQSFSQMEGLNDIALSTNGAKLTGQEKKLFQAGLHRINISLDTLDRKKFQEMTKIDALDEVLRGIYGCLDAGFRSVKINVVLIRGFNDDEMESFLNFAAEHPVDVRFIELMPSRSCYQRGVNQFFSADEALAILSRHRNLIPVKDFSGGVARLFHLEGGKGRIGFISPMSNNFCENCNRLRLTAKGALRLCLHAEKEIDLKKIIRSPNYNPSELGEVIKEGLLFKPWGQDLPQKREEDIELKMSQVGG